MRTFKPYDMDQPYLLPPDLRSWLPEGHLALFVSDVVEALDLSLILEPYERGDGRGYPPYHPVMMVKLIVYGYCTGKTSSRKLEKATWEDVACRVLAGNQQPDHDSIADFRRRHLKELAGLFVQVLKLCQEAGLVKLGHVSVDGTKVKANASRHKAMSYERMTETETRLVREVEALLAEAEAADKAEDAHNGKGKRGDELPDELRRRESRLRKIREAKAALEAEAKARAEAQADEARRRLAERDRQEAETGRKIGGLPPRIPDPEKSTPDPKAQKNFTDPESKIMLDGATKSFQQAYNAQIAVDGHAQIIVAAAVTQDGVDNAQLAPMLMAVKAHVGRLPEVATADNGYFNPVALADRRLAGVDLYVATGRERKATRSMECATPTPPATGSVPVPPGAPVSVVQQMRDKLATEAGKAIYKRRKCIPEPVFGQIKEARGFRRFSFRGLASATAEWTVIALTHNLLKLFRCGWNAASSGPALRQRRGAGGAP